ncbi:MAG: hypothetical protein R3181_10270 [Rubricoccaceae bacterium]|nr:hypothetical protein [Rubricoccaceae bacterium]
MLRALLRLASRPTPPVSLADARARAARGAAFLDGTDPGWHARLRTDTLALADGQACVLGQLHGEFRLGLLQSRVLDGSSARVAFVSPADLGFHARPSLAAAEEALDYTLLTRAWREEVARRRAAPAPSAPPPHPIPVAP